MSRLSLSLLKTCGQCDNVLNWQINSTSIDAKNYTATMELEAICAFCKHEETLSAEAEFDVVQPKIKIEGAK